VRQVRPDLQVRHRRRRHQPALLRNVLHLKTPQSEHLEILPSNLLVLPTNVYHTGTSGTATRLNSRS
jgi:hypothetical protein